MILYLQDPDVTLHHGDVLEVLRELSAESVDCVVTSPPYWGLRDYGTGEWEGGDAGCDHQKWAPWSDAKKKPASETYSQYRDTCGKCGATRIDRQLGLEPTPELYVERMVEVFREVRRVLAAHGTCWVNLGDSYNAHPGGGGDREGRALNATQGTGEQPQYVKGHGLSKVKSLKPKDLVGIPWRVAFALQADGWYLRSDIIWSKPNPMPESVTDRPTKAHEYLFLLAKAPRYFFDQEAVREQYQPSTIERDRYGYNHAFANQFKGSPTDERHPDGKVLPAGSFARGPDGRAKTTIEPGPGTHGNHQTGERERWPNSGRNIRSVWEIATQPFPEAHFATFPEELVRRCIAAGCREGGVVCDPFIGSGTTALVARKLGRRCIGIDLSESFLEMAARRLQQQSLFAVEAS